jgi:importin subunit beta-1
LGALQDVNVVVRDSATHCIGKICKVHLAAVSPDMIHNIIQGMIAKLQETPRIASHACLSVYNIAHTVKEDQAPETNILSAPMLPLLKELLKASDREDAVEGNLRISAMSAAAELVTAAGLDCQPIFRDFLPVIVQRIDAALKMQVVSKDDAESKEQILGHLCGLMQVLFLRLEKADVMPHADTVMNLVLQVLQVRNATCHEEAFLAIGAIVTAMDEDFTVRIYAACCTSNESNRSFYSHTAFYSAEIHACFGPSLGEWS